MKAERILACVCAVPPRCMHAPVSPQPSRPWLLLALILSFIALFLCSTLASHLLNALPMSPCFARRTGTFDGNQTAFGSHKSLRIVTSVYCPPSATVDVAPQSCSLWDSFMLTGEWGDGDGDGRHMHADTMSPNHASTHSHTEGPCDIYEARAKESHVVLRVPNEHIRAHPFIPSDCPLLPPAS